MKGPAAFRGRIELYLDEKGCRLCPFLRKHYAGEYHYCALTYEVMDFFDRQRGEDCPLEIEDLRQKED